VDLVTLTEELKKREVLEYIGGVAYLTDILDTVASSANVEHYAKIVFEKAALRKMIQVANKVLQMGYGKIEDADEAIDQAENLIFSVKESRIKTGFVPVKDVLKSSFETIEALSSKKKHSGIPSGFTELDDLTAGFQPSDLIIVAARPSMGKTAFCVNIAQHAAIDEGLPVGFFSLETGKEQLVQRLLCSEARVDAQRVRKGRLWESDWPKLTTAAGVLSDAPIYIDDTAAIPILELRAKARRLRASKDVQLIIVDYLQLIQGPRSSENRQQEISSISRALKGLAKELKIPIIAVSQLSRAVESRANRRPVLSDLRESGAIEQDADVVIFIYRDEVYELTEENKGLAEIKVGKQRNGPTGKITLTFIKEYTRFENLARGEAKILEEEMVE
jgi:replicative DNA helicase